MSNTEELDRLILETNYDVNGKYISGKKICKEFNIPEHVFLWRVKNVSKPKKLWHPMGRCVEVDGNVYPVEMLSQLKGVEIATIWQRWHRGVRGPELWEPPNNFKTEERVFSKERKEAEEQCRNHLRALCRAHRDMAQEIYEQGMKKKRGEIVLDDFDEAKAIRTAQKLQQRGCRGNGRYVFIRSSLS